MGGTWSRGLVITHQRNRIRYDHSYRPVGLDVLRSGMRTGGEQADREVVTLTEIEGPLGRGGLEPRSLPFTHSRSEADESRCLAF